MKNIILTLFLLINFGCSDNTPKTTEEYEAFAEKFCKCSEPSTVAFEETIHMIETENITDRNETVALFMDVITNSAEESGSCILETLGRDAMSFALNNSRANEIIRKKCPNSPFMMITGDFYETINNFIDEGGTTNDVVNEYLEGEFEEEEKENE